MATASTAPPPSATTHRQAQRQALRRAGSGMRAVFLGGSGPGNGSSGTGVFLPRGAGNDPSESRKKPSKILEPFAIFFIHCFIVFGCFSNYFEFRFRLFGYPLFS